MQIQVLHFNLSGCYSLCLKTGLAPSSELLVSLCLEMYSLQGNIAL